MHTKTLAMVLSGLVVLWGCGGSGGGTEPPVGLLDTEGGEDTRGEDAAADAADAGLDLGFADIPGDVAPECRAVPFGFGCPCEDNGDCASGFCVDGPFGGVCTESCLEECPEGWHCKGVSGIGPDLVFLCVPDSKKLCYPCDRDTQCGGGVCHALEDGSFCTYACDEATKCPATFHCEEVQDGGQAWSVCLPDSGSCACTAETEGQLRPCQAESTFGVCLGYETCDPDLGWVDCSAGEPAEETCDGKDNDCDGAFDEDLPETMPCENSVEGIGTCTGVATCLGPQGWVCSAGVPGIEVCDFLDNDCDGETDEDFKVDGKYGTQNHCGTCGHDCTGAIPNALSACDASLQTPLCVVGECDPGYFQLNEFQCLPEGETLCKPCVEDFQCEGGKCIPVGGAASCVLSCDQEPCPETFACTTVEGLEGSWCLPESGTCDCTGITGPVTKPCSQANEVGICFGVHSCDPTVGWSECTAPAAAAETCNGLDDDCDGVPDDGLPQNVPCQKVLEGVGTCTGVENCFGAQGFLCSATEPAAETCDYKDNDCDGESDEAFLADGKYATLEHCGACGQSCEGALPN
ncbi:MAG: hypothetical protein FJ098_12560, partial [Deltaproteobacteria bacterium]|nr:hypothetical protein [Deltaproteobacteria bacterium]